MTNLDLSKAKLSIFADMPWPMIRETVKFACGIKAHRKFLGSPVDELPGMQKTIYDELPQSFETRTGLVIAERYGMPERTFKRWLSTSLFRKITHGFYDKRYR